MHLNHVRTFPTREKLVVDALMASDSLRSAVRANLLGEICVRDPEAIPPGPSEDASTRF